MQPCSSEKRCGHCAMCLLPRSRRPGKVRGVIVYHGKVRPTRSTSVDALDMTVMVRNVLANAGIKTCGQLADAMTDPKIYRPWRNFGNCGERDVLQALTHFGLWPVQNGFEDGAGI